MLANGVKRKLEEDVVEADGRVVAVGGVSQASYTLQQQTVLNMSLIKLYRPQTGADLSLQRCVLINNIIRRIHDDIGTLFFSATPPTAIASAHEDEGYRQAPPPPSSFSILSSPLTVLNPCLTPASLLEEDLPMIFTMPSISTLEEIEELCPPSSSSPSPPPARVLFDVVMKEEGRSFQEVQSWLEKPPVPPSPSSCGPFLTDFALDDVLFTVTDTSMYNLSPCTPPSAAPPSKMAPVVTTDDLVNVGAQHGGWWWCSEPAF